MLPVFREQNPQLAIETRTNPGHHPWLKAEYRAPLLASPHPQHALGSAACDRGTGWDVQAAAMCGRSA